MSIYETLDLVSILFLSVMRSMYFVIASNQLKELPVVSGLDLHQIENDLVTNLLSYFGVTCMQQSNDVLNDDCWTKQLIVSDIGIYSKKLQRRVITEVLRRMHIAGFSVNKPRYVAYSLLWRITVSIGVGILNSMCKFSLRVCCGYYIKKEVQSFDRIAEFLEAKDLDTKRFIMKFICADLGLALKIPSELKKNIENINSDWTDSKLLRFFHFITADACSQQRIWKMEDVNDNFGYGCGNIASAECIEISGMILAHLESLSDCAANLPDDLTDDILRVWIQFCEFKSPSKDTRLRRVNDINAFDSDVLDGISVVLFSAYYSINKTTTFTSLPEFDKMSGNWWDWFKRKGWFKSVEEALEQSRAPIFSKLQMDALKLRHKAFSSAIVDDNYPVDGKVINQLRTGYAECVSRLKNLSNVIVASRTDKKSVSLMVGVALSNKNVFIGVTEKYRQDAVELLIWLSLPFDFVIPVLDIDDSNKVVHTWILKRVSELVFSPTSIIDKLKEGEREIFSYVLTNLHSSIKEAWFRRFHQDSLTITAKALNKIKSGQSVNDLAAQKRSCCEDFESAQKKLQNAFLSNTEYKNIPVLTDSELSALFVWFDRQAICLEPLLTPHSKSLDLVCIQFGPAGEHATEEIGFHKRWRAKPCQRYCSLFSSAHIIWSRLVEGVTRNSLQDNFQDESDYDSSNGDYSDNDNLM